MSVVYVVAWGLQTASATVLVTYWMGLVSVAATALQMQTQTVYVTARTPALVPSMLVKCAMVPVLSTSVAALVYQMANVTVMATLLMNVVCVAVVALLMEPVTVMATLLMNVVCVAVMALLMEPVTVMATLRTNVVCVAVMV